MKFLGLIIIVGFLFLLFQTNSVYAQTNSTNRNITVQVVEYPTSHGLPVNITEKINISNPLDTVTVWQIPMMPTPVKSNATYLAPGVNGIPYSFMVIDNKGNNILDLEHSKGFTIGENLSVLQATCTDNNIKPVFFIAPVEAALITNASSDIFVKYRHSELIPDSNYVYNLIFSSFFNTEIILPKDTVMISNKTEICSLSYDGFSKVTLYNVVFKMITSPLMQFKLGINIDHIHCRDFFYLILKKEDRSPACASPMIAEKLIEIGWAEPQIMSQNKELTKPWPPTILNEGNRTKSHFSQNNSSKSVQIHS